MINPVRRKKRRPRLPPLPDPQPLSNYGHSKLTQRYNNLETPKETFTPVRHKRRPLRPRFRVYTKDTNEYLILKKRYAVKYVNATPCCTRPGCSCIASICLCGSDPSTHKIIHTYRVIDTKTNKLMGWLSTREEPRGSEEIINAIVIDSKCYKLKRC